jgi:hypothetical protein
LHRFAMSTAGHASRDPAYDSSGTRSIETRIG